MIAVKRLSPSSYEVDDVVALVEDGHVFSPRDLQSGERGGVDVGPLTEDEQATLLMGDNQFLNMAAITQIPTFRHYLFHNDNMTEVSRRKYKLDENNEAALKVNIGVGATYVSQDCIKYVLEYFNKKIEDLKKDKKVKKTK